MPAGLRSGPKKEAWKWCFQASPFNPVASSYFVAAGTFGVVVVLPVDGVMVWPAATLPAGVGLPGEMVDVPIWPLGEVAPGMPAELDGAVCDPLTVGFDVCAIAEPAARNRAAAKTAVVFIQTSIDRAVRPSLMFQNGF